MIAPQRGCSTGAAGELDAAFHHLDRALDLRDPGLVYLAVAPQWDSLRDDPRFADRLSGWAWVRVRRCGVFSGRLGDELTRAD